MKLSEYQLDISVSSGNLWLAFFLLFADKMTNWLINNIIIRLIKTEKIFSVSSLASSDLISQHQFWHVNNVIYSLWKHELELNTLALVVTKHSAVFSLYSILTVDR